MNKRRKKEEHEYDDGFDFVKEDNNGDNINNENINEKKKN